ncbi:MAG: protein-disulfide reductase DsbD family protein [Proteobacteria bacterium]|nr:protein-disulfide reductase DsbD family protein [Pseudomonadota bacterium]MDA0914799.1 protein-disulfide reductase DsbD family protein [Pseudomonadota bacterium]MDA1032076.1 protein-disulfide reductase DsbD family protein [Pseudomonadota bacterium]
MIQARMFKSFGAFWLLFSLLGMLALATSARAQDNNLVGSLHAEGPAAAGETSTLAIHFEPVSDEWHGYWSNPGDAGLGMALDWELPEGWQAGVALYPVPQKLSISGLMNHVYKGAYAVLVPISVPADYVPTGPVSIAVKGEWLACTDVICVPEQVRMTTIIPAEGSSFTPDQRFAVWRTAIAPSLGREGTYELTADTLRIAIPIPATMSLSAPHVFMSNTRVVDYAATQTFWRNGDLLVAEIPRKGRGEFETIEGILAFGDGNGVRFAAQAGEVPTGAALIAGQPASTPPMWTLILGAMVGGLILNIMPCVFPILSLKAISLARAGESEAQARNEGIAYTAGVVLACVALGGVMLALRAAGEQVGWAFQLQSPSVVVFLLILAAVITANFAGVFELPSLSFTLSGEPASAFATGLLAAFAATPCTGPFMAVALGAALFLPPVLALLLFAALGLGLALPFLLIGFVPALRRMLPKPGAWMNTFRRLMAIPMGLTALALVWLTQQLGGRNFAMFALIVVFGVIMALWVVGKLQQRGKMAWPAFGLISAPFLVFGAFALPSAYAEQSSSTAESILSPRPFSEVALAEARASVKPVFLWFTADWCVTCKVNEGVAIERETTKAAFDEAGVIAMVGDWTRRDAEISIFLNKQGAAGVPLYLWYEPGQEAEQLPQVLTPDMLIQRAKRDNPQ